RTDRIGQGSDQRVLADQLREIRGAILSGQHPIRSRGHSVSRPVPAFHLVPERPNGPCPRNPSSLQWRVGNWTTTRAENRYGCFLPDLTGLATSPSAA